LFINLRNFKMPVYFNSKLDLMAEEIIDITPISKNEPWCTSCSGFTDYQRKWTTYPRADLDGGTYAENIEIPHCTVCQNPMYDLRSCKQLLWGFRLLGATILGLSTLVCFIMYDLSVVSLTVWMFFLIVTTILVKAPSNSRRALNSYALFLDKEKLMNSNKPVRKE